MKVSSKREEKSTVCILPWFRYMKREGCVQAYETFNKYKHFTNIK